MPFFLFKRINGGANETSLELVCSKFNATIFFKTPFNLCYLSLMWKNIIWIIRTILIYSILCMGTFLMLRTIINYTSFKSDIQFLALKQDYITNSVWKFAFYVHTFSAVFALLAGFTQFSKQFLQDYRKLHKIFGRLYVWDILVINFPAGFIMAIYANGGLAGKMAFLTLDILWFWFTFKAFTAALNKNFKKHRDYMIRSYALTFSALTLRTWKIVMTHLGWVDVHHIYIVDAWLAFIPNLILAEWIIHFIRSSDQIQRMSQSKEQVPLQQHLKSP